MVPEPGTGHMNSALTDRLVNVIFAMCCVGILGIAIARYRAPPAPVHVARENILKPGAPARVGRWEADGLHLHQLELSRLL
jgi:hypothetical protein